MVSLSTHVPQLALSTSFFGSLPSGFTDQTSHLSGTFASCSRTQPFLLRQNRMRLPSGEKRGNQSTVSPLVIAWTPEPSVFMTKRSWLPRRELDQTMVPFTRAPIAFIAAWSASEGCSSPPEGGAPDMLA